MTNPWGTPPMTVQVKEGAAHVNGRTVQLAPTHALTLHPRVNAGTIELQTPWGPETFHYRIIVSEEE